MSRESVYVAVSVGSSDDSCDGVVCWAFASSSVSECCSDYSAGDAGW